MAIPKGRFKARSRGSEKKSKDQPEIQRLKIENSQLRRQLSRLRKQITRINTDEYENVEEALGAQNREDEIIGQQKLIEHWRCFHCNDDYLRLIIVQRPDGAFYFRRCPNCERRTRLKPLEDSVVGPPSNGSVLPLKERSPTKP